MRNAEAMAGGVYHTGDVAERDASGMFTYVGAFSILKHARENRGDTDFPELKG